jgi:hypothetical protein
VCVPGFTFHQLERSHLTMSTATTVDASRRETCTGLYRNLLECAGNAKNPAALRLREFFSATEQCDDVVDFSADRAKLASSISYFDNTALDRILHNKDVSARDELIAQQETKSGRDRELYYNIDRAIKKLNPLTFKNID